jgi:hypothetical protein
MSFLVTKENGGMASFHAGRRSPFRESFQVLLHNPGRVSCRAAVLVQ